VPKLRKVNSLKHNDDFLMHGVVLQNRVFPPPITMFHVKHALRKNGHRAGAPPRCFM
jgi:hypothetical protein